MLPRDAHGLISHDHQETGPLAFREPYQGKQGGVVNFVGSDQHPLPGKCQCPQAGVGKPLFPSAPNVLDVVTEFPEANDSHQGDVLVPRMCIRQSPAI